MGDLCKQTVEHGIHVWILEAVEQRTESSQTKIHSTALQSAIQEVGE